MRAVQKQTMVSTRRGSRVRLDQIHTDIVVFLGKGCITSSRCNVNLLRQTTSAAIVRLSVRSIYAKERVHRTFRAVPLTNKTQRQRQETKWLKGDSSYGEREKGGEDGGTEMEIEGHSFQVVVLALVVASGGPAQPHVIRCRKTKAALSAPE